MAGRLNYTTHAIEDIQRLLHAGPFGDRDKLALRGVSSLMRQAQKFMLPDRGELIFDRGDMPLETEVYRLPFPLTLIEFPFTQREGEVQPNIETASSRRIAVAVEGDYVPMGNLQCTFSPRPGAGGFAVQVISYVDKYRAWCVMPAQAYIAYGAKTVSPTSTHSPYSKVKTASATPFVMFGLMPDAFLKAQDDPTLGPDALSNDIAREINILTEFLSVLSCANVSTEIQAAPKALNRARQGKKKEPLYDYHVLVIDGGVSTGPSHSGERNDGDPKVRTHLRRGHIRRLDGGARRIWVNATIVAPGSKLGVAGKEYRVRPGR